MVSEVLFEDSYLNLPSHLPSPIATALPPSLHKTSPFTMLPPNLRPSLPKPQAQAQAQAQPPPQTINKTGHLLVKDLSSVTS